MSRLRTDRLSRFRTIRPEIDWQPFDTPYRIARIGEEASVTLELPADLTDRLTPDDIVEAIASIAEPYPERLQGTLHLGTAEPLQDAVTWRAETMRLAFVPSGPVPPKHAPARLELRFDAVPQAGLHLTACTIRRRPRVRF